MKLSAFLASGLLALSVTVNLGPSPANASTRHPSTIVAVTAQIRMFATEAAAQAHCPRGVVVWQNIPTGIYHEKGTRWYGRTKNGAYVCKKEADAAGDRIRGMVSDAIK